VIQLFALISKRTYMKAITWGNYLIAAFLFFLLYRTPVAQADSYDLYVNASASSDGEDGSVSHPFTTIGKGIARAMQNNKSNRRIYAANGTYNEHITLGESVILTGESKDSTIIEGNDVQDVVVMNDGSEIGTLTISNARKGVIVSKNSKVMVRDCKIRDMSDVGVEISASSKKGKKASIVNSEIWSGEKGVYALEGANLEISGNDIYGNKQEGIDIRPRVKGNVSGNNIHDNGESGIELIVGKSSVKIKNNNLHGNGASGIALQYYKQYSSKGAISLTNNKVKSNDNYAIACKIVWGNLSGKGDYFKDSAKVSQNSVDGDKKVDPLCRFSKI